jgi:hypothetical protein
VRALGCKEQLTPTTSVAKSLPHVLGLASDGWIGSPTLTFEHSIATTNGAYDEFKTYTYDTRSAAARTSIHMEAPEDGLLFYTSGSKWNNQLTDTQVVEGATRLVTLSGCRPQPAGYAGEFVLKRPACVRLLVVAHRPGTDMRRRLAVPMGKPLLRAASLRCDPPTRRGPLIGRTAHQSRHVRHPMPLGVKQRRSAMRARRCVRRRGCRS